MTVRVRGGKAHPWPVLLLAELHPNFTLSGRTICCQTEMEKKRKRKKKINANANSEDSTYADNGIIGFHHQPTHHNKMLPLIRIC